MGLIQFQVKQAAVVYEGHLQLGLFCMISLYHECLIYYVLVFLYIFVLDTFLVNSCLVRLNNNLKLYHTSCSI